MNTSLSKLQELAKDREAWRAAVQWGCKELDMTEQLNWTEPERVELNGMGYNMCPLYCSDSLSDFLQPI